MAIVVLECRVGCRRLKKLEQRVEEGTEKGDGATKKDVLEWTEDGDGGDSVRVSVVKVIADPTENDIVVVGYDTDPNSGWWNDSGLSRYPEEAWSGKETNVDQVTVKFIKHQRTKM